MKERLINKKLFIILISIFSTFLEMIIKNKKNRYNSLFIENELFDGSIIDSVKVFKQ